MLGIRGLADRQPVSSLLLSWYRRSCADKLRLLERANRDLAAHLKATAAKKRPLAARSANFACEPPAPKPDRRLLALCARRVAWLECAAVVDAWRSRHAQSRASWHATVQRWQLWRLRYQASWTVLRRVFEHWWLLLGRAPARQAGRRAGRDRAARAVRMVAREISRGRVAGVLCRMRHNWELARSECRLCCELNLQSIRMLEEMRRHSAVVAIAQLLRQLSRRLERCTFGRWRDRALIESAISVHQQTHKREGCTVREAADLQMRRVRHMCALRMVSHTIGRAGQLSLHRSFRAWQLPVLLRATEAASQREHESELKAIGDAHSDDMRKLLTNGRLLRAAGLMVRTIGSAWTRHKQRAMQLWAGFVVVQQLESATVSSRLHTLHKRSKEHSQLADRARKEAMAQAGMLGLGRLVRGWRAGRALRAVARWQRAAWSGCRPARRDRAARAVRMVAREISRGRVAGVLCRMRHNWWAQERARQAELVRRTAAAGKLVRGWQLRLERWRSHAIQHWKQVCIASAVSESNRQAFKQQARELRQVYSAQTKLLDRRSLCQAGLRMCSHTIGRAGRLSLHRSFRAWQLPVLLRLVSEPLEHERVVQAELSQQSISQTRRQMDRAGRQLRAAGLMVHTICSAWSRHKQSVMQLWAGAGRYRGLYRRAIEQVRRGNERLLLCGVGIVESVAHGRLLCRAVRAVLSWHLKTVLHAVQRRFSRQEQQAGQQARLQSGAVLLLLLLARRRRESGLRAVLQMRENWVATCMKMLVHRKFHRQSAAMRHEMQKQSGVFALFHLLRGPRAAAVSVILLVWRQKLASNRLAELKSECDRIQAAHDRTEKQLLESRHDNSEMRDSVQKLKVGLEAAKSQCGKYQKRVQHLSSLQEQQQTQRECLDQLVRNEATDCTSGSVSALRERNQALQVLYEEGTAPVHLSADLWQARRGSSLWRASWAGWSSCSGRLSSGRPSWSSWLPLSLKRSNPCPVAGRSGEWQVANSGDEAVVGKLEEQVFALRMQESQLQTALWKVQTGLELSAPEGELALGVMERDSAKIEEFVVQLDLASEEMLSIGDESLGCWVDKLLIISAGLKQLITDVS